MTTSNETMTSSDSINVQEITLSCSDGIELAAQRWTTNESSDPPTLRILCLHGFLDNCRSFHTLAPKLLHETRDTELVALDFPGHGHSSHTSKDHPPFLVDCDLVYYVAEAVRQLEWESGFTLIGHSMGSIVSIMYTAAFPEHVETLVLLDGYGPDFERPHRVADRLRRHVLQRYQGNTTTTTTTTTTTNAGQTNNASKQRRIYPTLQSAVQQRQQTARNCPGNQWLSHQTAMEMVQWAVVQSEDGAAGGFQFRHDARLQWLPIQLHTLEQVDGYWKNLSCPTLWLRAEYGWPYAQKWLDRAEAILGDKGTVVVLPGSHHFHADPETADAVVDTILNYV
jgi:pimeloyl-ACP methyl ester carboxylesterase